MDGIPRVPGLPYWQRKLTQWIMTRFFSYNPPWSRDKWCLSAASMAYACGKAKKGLGRKELRKDVKY
jgi:hypothetical protein